MLSIENISKVYGNQVLFKRASFQISDQARIGCIGPNGAGKSTFFRMLVGEEQADGGDIRFPKNYRVALLRQEWEPVAGDSVLEAALRVYGGWFSARARLRTLQHEIDQHADDKTLAAYHDAEHEFLAYGGYEIEQRGKEMLTGLGFKPAEMPLPIVTFSGGWRMRCQLAGLLLQDADLLLLDEPTNHLDVESVLWFEQFLQNYQHAFLVISHDRRLIDRLSQQILEFTPPSLTLWPGGLKQFEAQKSTRMQLLESEIANKQREIDRLHEFIDRFRAKATKARQAQNRLKTADSYREEIENLKALMPLVSRRPARFKLKTQTRLPRLVLQYEKAVFGYEKSRPLFHLDKGVIEAGKKIGIIGVNGVGKSTFLKSCAGELPLLGGSMVRPDQVSVGFFAQHRMEELPGGIKTYDYLAEKSQGISVTDLRAVAATLGLTENDLDKPLDVLSGGEKARVSLSRILLSRPGLLLLDEPTNHLDMEACDALVRGLSDYDGTVLIVSHDRDFLDTLVDYILEVRPGEAILYHGGYKYWLDKRHPELVAAKTTAKTDADKEAATIGGKKSGEQKRLEAEARQRRFAKVKEIDLELQTVDRKMREASEALKQLDVTLCLPESPKHADFSKWLKERGRLASELEQVERLWMQLSERREKLQLDD